MKNYLLVLCLFITGMANSQTLERKGSLGAHIETLDSREGVRINQVIPNSTAENIGLEAGDFLLAVDGMATPHNDALLEHTLEWRAGQTVSLTVERNGSKTAIEGEVKGKARHC